MAYFLLLFFLCSAFITVCRSCSCLPSHPQNEYCNSAFGEYTSFLDTTQQPCCTALLDWRTHFKLTPSFHRSTLFDCSVVVFWHTHLFQTRDQRDFIEKNSSSSGYISRWNPRWTKRYRNSFVEMYKDGNVSIKSLVRVYYFQQDCVRNTVTHFLSVALFLHYEAEGLKAVFRRGY